MNTDKKIDYHDAKTIMDDKTFIPELIQNLPDSVQFNQLIKHEIFFYAEEAHKYKVLCNIFTLLSIMLPISVTAISALSEITPFSCKLMITCISAISSIFAGLLETFHIREKWLSYRSSCEKLKIEICKYLSNAEPYTKLDESETERLFRKNCEKIFEHDRHSWIDNNRVKDLNE